MWPMGAHTNGAEAVDDPPTDILSKPITEPCADPGGGGGIGLGAPPASLPQKSGGGTAGSSCMLGGGCMGMFTTLACACGVAAHIVDRWGWC